MQSIRKEEKKQPKKVTLSFFSLNSPSTILILPQSHDHYNIMRPRSDQMIILKVGV